MPALMDYLDALHQGIWEVIIPKTDVTEPLGDAWKRSPINVPSPETIASYRNGQYHVHETAEDFRVHLDRYDPQRNPVMHLVDDAPLALMILETLETLTVSAKDAKRGDPVARITNLRLSGGMRILFGLLVIAIGAVLLLLALGNVGVLFDLIIPALVVLAGVVELANGIRLRVRGEHARKDAVRGVILITGGFLLYLFWKVYVVLLLAILAAWFLSSAIVSFLRVIRTRGRLPQGFAFTLGLGIISVLFGYWAFVDPERLGRVLVFVLSLVFLLGGAFMLFDGYGMRNAAGLIEARQTESESAARS